MTKRSDGRTLSGDLLRSGLESLDVRPVFTPGWKTTALDAWLPTAPEWEAGTPQIIGSNMARMVKGGEATVRLYASETANIARQKQTEGRFTGWAWVRHFATADPPLGLPPLRELSMFLSEEAGRCPCSGSWNMVIAPTRNL